MIDYFLKFASLAAAKADPMVLQHYDQLSDLFAADRVIPNLQVWRDSQDVTDTNGNVTHTFLPGWYAMIALDRVIPALRDYSATVLALNRNRQLGDNLVISKQFTNAILLDIRFSPVFAGSYYPFGGIS